MKDIVHFVRVTVVVSKRTRKQRHLPDASWLAQPTVTGIVLVLVTVTPLDAVAHYQWIFGGGSSKAFICDITTLISRLASYPVFRPPVRLHIERLGG